MWANVRTRPPIRSPTRAASPVPTSVPEKKVQGDRLTSNEPKGVAQGDAPNAAANTNEEATVKHPPEPTADKPPSPDPSHPQGNVTDNAPTQKRDHIPNNHNPPTDPNPSPNPAANPNNPSTQDPPNDLKDNAPPYPSTPPGSKHDHVTKDANVQMPMPGQQPQLKPEEMVTLVVEELIRKGLVGNGREN